MQTHIIMDLNHVLKHKATGGHTPGRQCILFLIWSNLSLFVYYCVQTIHSIFTTTVIGTYVPPYKMLIALALPFVLFYRFHSSAILAELYKHHCSEHKKEDEEEVHAHHPENHPGNDHRPANGESHAMKEKWNGRERNIPIKVERTNGYY